MFFLTVILNKIHFKINIPLGVDNGLNSLNLNTAGNFQTLVTIIIDLDPKYMVHSSKINKLCSPLTWISHTDSNSKVETALTR